MIEEKNVPKWIPIAVSIATLLVPILYIFGNAYDQGYLRAYGINNQFFVRSVPEYLMLSFTAFANIFFALLGLFAGEHILILAFIVGLIGLVVVVLDKHRIAQRLKQRTSGISKHWLFDYVFFPVISACLGVTLPFTILAAICMIFVIPSAAYFNGRSVGEKEIKSAQPCSYVPVPTGNCVFVVDEKKVVSGTFVSRSETHLALFNQGKTSIYPIKDQIVEVTPNVVHDVPAVVDTPH